MASTELKIVFSSEDKVNTSSVKRKFSELREVGEKISNLGTKISAVFTLPIAGLTALLLKNEELAKSLQPIKDEFNKVVASLAQGLIPVIKDITPAILNIVKGIGDLVKQFNALSVEQKENILKWVGLVAAIGPAIFLIGQVINFVGTLGVVFSSAAAGTWAFAGSLAALAAAIFAVYKLFQMKEFKQLWAIGASNQVSDPVLKAQIAQETFNRLGGNNSDDELGAMIRGLVTAPPSAKAGAGTPVVINYAPMISTADQAQAKKVLTPIIQDAMRSFVPTR